MSETCRLGSLDGENCLQKTGKYVKIGGKMSQELIDETVNKYVSKNWSVVGSNGGLAFLSPTGEWLNYINTETGDFFHFNRRWAEMRGFYVSINQKQGKGDEQINNISE